jgi:uncharacterized protein YgiM (DUF1202 family)
MRYLAVLMLVMLIACTRAAQSSTPSSTLVATGAPTLGPAAATGQSESATAPSATGASTPQEQVPAVATDVLNVRSGPGLDYAIKSQLKQGDAITIIGKSADGLWWQFSGGWVSATYVKASGDTSAVPVTTPTP